MTTLQIHTEAGRIDLRLLPESAPLTVQHITEAVSHKIYNNRKCSFYRSDFVIQCGLHGTSSPPYPNLKRNESYAVTPRIGNTRGTAAFAHFDVPDNGSSEFFINLGDNSHLDDAYGGFCVFAVVERTESFAVVDEIAKIVRTTGHPVLLHSMKIV